MSCVLEESAHARSHPDRRRLAAADSVREIPAAERADGDSLRGPPGAGGGGGPLVPRRRGERAQGPERVRPSLRAPDVPGEQAPERGRAHRVRDARPQRRHQLERDHRLGPDQLLRDHARGPGGARALAGERSDGLPPRYARSEEARHAAGGRAQRAPPDHRERTVRASGGAAGAAPLSRSSSVLPLRDQVQLAKVLIGYVGPKPLENPAIGPLVRILAGGKSGRLYHDLVYEKKIAQDVSASWDPSMQLGGIFEITATVQAGHTPEEVVAALTEEVRRLREAPPSPEELERAKRNLESGLFAQLDNVGGFGGKADQLHC